MVGFINQADWSSKIAANWAILGVVLQATEVYKAPNRFLAKTCASDIGVL